MKFVAAILLFFSFSAFSQKEDSTSTNYRWGINVGMGLNNQSIQVKEVNYPSQSPFYSLGFTFTRFISKKWEVSTELMNNFGTIKNIFQVDKNAYHYESDYVGFNIPLNVKYTIAKIDHLYFLPHFVQVGPSVNFVAHNIEKFEVNNAAVSLAKKSVLDPEYRIKIGTGYVFSLTGLQFRTEFNYYLPIKSATNESNLVANLSSMNNPAFNFNLIIENKFTKAQLKDRRKKQWAKLNLFNTLKNKR